MTFFCEDCKFIDECKPHKDNPQSLGCCDFGLFDDEGLIEDWDKEAKIDRTYRDDPYEYMSQEPCDYCIELECENHGVVCPFYKEEKEAENDSK